MEEIKVSDIVGGARDYWLASAGDDDLGEELRTGRCRCGTLLAEESRGCRWHEAGRRRIGEMLRDAMRQVVRVDGHGAAGPRGEDLELLGRFLPPDFLFVYEVLVHRGLVVPGSSRGGRGYDETVVRGTGRRVGGLGTPKSGVRERGLAAGVQKNGSSGRPVVRSEAAVVYRAKIDRRLRKLGRDILSWLDGGLQNKTIRRCSGRCKRLAEDGWNYCPNCGSPTEEVASRED